MPERLKPEEIKGWVTRNGKKVPIPKKEDDAQEAGEKMPNKTAEKEKFKEETKKSYVMRTNIIKSQFRIRDQVAFDQFEKAGIVYGFEGDYLKIYSKGNHITRLASNVFKKAEMIGDAHWDAISRVDRAELLKSKSVSQSYIDHSWIQIPYVVRMKIQKESPAGYSGSGISTVTQGVWNPVNTDKTVTEQIDESKKKKDEKKQSD